jgi:hypothetical protein
MKFKEIAPKPALPDLSAQRGRGGIAVHSSDDRGMEIICRTSSTLKGPYQRRNVWLLDYNGVEMTVTFKSA